MRKDNATNPALIANRKRLKKLNESELMESFLEPDERDNQVKSLEDEAAAIISNKILIGAEDGGDSVNEDQVSVEYASDEEMVSDDDTGVRTRNQRKKAGDDEFTCMEEDEDADSQIAMDQLEVEVLSEDEDDKVKSRKAKRERTVTRRHRSDVEEAKLEDDE